MNLKLFRSLPIREQSLLVVGCLIDSEHVETVLADDMRQSEAFSKLLLELLVLPKDLREITLLSILAGLVSEKDSINYV